jgi:hypothetical protein
LGSQDKNTPVITINKCRSGNTEMNGRIIFQIAMGGNDYTRCLSIDDGDSLPKNKWMFVTGVCDYENSLIHLYIDGVLQDSQPLIKFDMTSVSDFRVLIGDYTNQNTGEAWQNNHNGLMDEVRVYNHALTQTEIISLYNLK